MAEEGTATNALTGEAQAAPQQAAPQQEAPQEWYGGFQDESVRGWVSTKGFKSAEALARSAHNLEKHIGVPEERLVRLPADPNDQDAWRDVYGKLGVPEDVSGYELPEDAQWVGEVAHKNGIRPDALKSLIEAYSERTESVKQEMAQKAAEEREMAVSQLRTEWGKAADERFEAGSRVIEKLGITQEMADAIRSQVGAKAFIEKMVEIGMATGDGRMLDGESSTSRSMGMTPDQARSKLEQMKGDPGFIDRWHSKDPAVRDAAIREMREVSKWIS